MTSFKIKSYAKINLALNITGKVLKLHKIESIVCFIDLHDLIYVKLTNTKNPFYFQLAIAFSSNINLLTNC